MIRTFIALKLRLLRNGLLGSNGFGMVIFSIAALGIGGATGVALWTASSADRALAAPILGAALTLGWVLGPLLFGASDETIDTTRLAMFPLEARPLALGMATAGLIGPGPLAALIPLVVLAVRSPNPMSMALGLSAAVATIAVATMTSRWLLTVLGSRLRQRRSRDLATVIAGIGAASFGIGMQILSRFGTNIARSQIESVVDIVRWTPFGWSGDALGRASSGNGLLVGWAQIAGALLLLAVVLQQWIRSLHRALTEVDEGDELDAIGGNLIAEPSRARPQIISRIDPAMGAVLAKERRYLFRHPRYRVQVLSQGLVLVLGGAPFLSAIAARNPQAVLMGSIPGLTAGVTGSNLLGTDGRSLWSEFVALPSMKTLLRGRSLAFIGLGTAAATVVTLGVAGWTGGWRFAPTALGAAIGMAFTGAGIGSYTSTLAPTPFPEEGTANPFATSSPGGGCLNGIVTLVGVVVGLVASLPILAGLAFSRGSYVVGGVTTVLAPLYGMAIWMVMTRFAGANADERAPEIMLKIDSS